jgi:hypothetical protein
LRNNDASRIYHQKGEKRKKMTFMCKTQIILLAAVISGANVLVAEEGELDPTRQAREALHKKVVRGFFPVGTEFAHPLHYVDLNADGELGEKVDGVVDNKTVTYEFPGTRSRRVKELRYMYKWKEVGIDDIDEDAHYDDFVIGNEGQGWVDNNAGWLLAAFIEDRRGELRLQTTEELMQCIGCHGKVGNTVDSVWSFGWYLHDGVSDL